MEFAFPIGVIVYIVLAVVGAVLKSYTNQQARRHHPAGQPVPPQAPTVPAAQAEHVQADRVVKSAVKPDVYNEFNSLSVVEEKREQVSKPRTARVLSRQDLRQAVVMAEILREPRAKRPWPNR